LNPPAQAAPSPLEGKEHEQAGAGAPEEEWDAELAAEIAALDRAAERAAEMEEREKLARLVREEIAREMQGDC
jgi:hypothetical protein